MRLQRTVHAQPVVPCLPALPRLQYHTRCDQHARLGTDHTPCHSSDFSLNCPVHLMIQLLEKRARTICLPSLQGGQAPMRAGCAVVSVQALVFDPHFITY